MTSVPIIFGNWNQLRGLFGTKTYLVPWKQLFQHIAEGSLRNSLLLMDPMLDAQHAMLRQIPDRSAIRTELGNLQNTLEQSALQPDLRRLLLLGTRQDPRGPCQREVIWRDPRSGSNTSA